MTETTSPAETKIHPSEVLMRVIIALLTPAFLTASGGDTTIARLAAFETIKQYNPRSHVDLIIVAQVIACGLASAASVGLSFQAELSASMTLRLRANAAALSRAADRAARALDQPLKQPAPEPPTEAPFTPADAAYEAEVIAGVAASQALVNEAIARHKAAPASPPRRTQAPPRAPVPSPIDFLTDTQWDAMWASAMTGAEEDLAAELASLPPHLREEAIRKAAILSEVAQEMFAEAAPPSLRPGGANPVPLTPAATDTSSRRND